jgi:hypothetical protein
MFKGNVKHPSIKLQRNSKRQNYAIHNILYSTFWATDEPHILTYNMEQKLYLINL